MKKLISALAMFAVSATAGLARTDVTEYRGAAAKTGEVLLLLDEQMHPEDVAHTVQKEGFQLLRARLVNGQAVDARQYVANAAALQPTRTVVVGYDPDAVTLEEAIERLSGQPGILAAEPNYLRYASFTPNDPRYGSQWGLPKIGCPTAWDKTKGRSDILVAIVDTGVDYRHVDFNKNYRADLGKDTVNNDNDPMDGHGHGTHVSGTVAEATHNSEGGAGVAPDVSILGVKVLSDQGSGTDEQVSAGIDHAAAVGAHVVNMSLGGDETNSILEASVQNAWARGVFMACATGNDSRRGISYPAAYEGCTPVGATSSFNGKASFSNTGPELQQRGVAAPGVGVLSMYKGSYASLSGTSMATPHVAGVAALVFSAAATGTTATNVREVLRSTAQDMGDAGADESFGAGLVRADRAVAAVAP